MSNSGLHNRYISMAYSQYRNFFIDEQNSFFFSVCIHNDSLRKYLPIKKKFLYYFFFVEKNLTQC